VTEALSRVPGPSFEALVAVARAVEEASRAREDLTAFERLEAEALDAFDPVDALAGAVAAPLPRRDVELIADKPSALGLPRDEFLRRFVDAARADGASDFLCVITIDRPWDGDNAAFRRAIAVGKLAFFARLIFRPPSESDADDDGYFHWSPAFSPYTIHYNPRIARGEVPCARGIRQFSARRGNVDDTMAMIEATSRSGRSGAVRFQAWECGLWKTFRLSIQEYHARDPATHRTCVAMAATRLGSG